jgi:hypothetical protein
MGLEPTQSLAELFRDGRGEGVEPSLGIGCHLDGGATGNEDCGNCISITGAAGLREAVSTKGFTCGPSGVEVVVFPAHPSRWAAGDIDLADGLPVRHQPSCEPSAPAAAALDDPASGPEITIGDVDQLCEPGWVRCHRVAAQLLTCGRSHKGGGMGVFVWIDTDDDINRVCKHGHCALLLAVAVVAALGRISRRRQICDGTRQTV